MYDVDEEVRLAEQMALAPVPENLNGNANCDDETSKASRSSVFVTAACLFSIKTKKIHWTCF